MYYLFHGKDTAKSRAKMKNTIASFFAKNPHSNVFRISPDNFDEGEFLEYLGSQSLFSNKFLISADGVLENERAREFILDNIEKIQASPNVFVFLEEKIKKAELDRLGKFAEKVFEFELSEKLNGKGEKGFNIFSICDALGEKDKKKTWIVYNKAVREGIASEEIFWKFAWQIKNLLLAKIAEERGDRMVEKLKINLFVLSKAKKYSRNFSKEELINLYRKLVSLYHEGRKGVLDFDLAIEAFILSL